jgi:ribosome biogenesis GTPase / thiamine phosphate phosphatase
LLANQSLPLLHEKPNCQPVSGFAAGPALQGLALLQSPAHSGRVNDSIDQSGISMDALGWTAFFDDQKTPADAALEPARIATVHRARMSVETRQGPARLMLPPQTNTAHFAVGDWVLIDPETNTLVRRLDRMTLLQRRTEGGGAPQLIAANVDTLFIVTSCNDDLNPARLERYLALANEAGTTPVIVLTKADQVPDTAPYRDQVTGLQRGLQVVAVNAHSPDAATHLAPWCGNGQTVALVGSSGVGSLHC